MKNVPKSLSLLKMGQIGHRLSLLNSDLICSQDSIGVVPPPNTQTVKNTMSRVVVNIICRAYVAVSRIARANAIAPRSPAEHKHTHSSHNRL